jgi:hypothetical protein
MSTTNFTTELTTKSDKTGHFSILLKNALFGFCLNIKEHVLATHKELAILRQCSKLLHEAPGRRLCIVSSTKKSQTNFIVNTLLHLGVSCGQIEVNQTVHKSMAPDGVWLLIGTN